MENIFEQKFIVELSDININFGLKSTAILKYYQETFARYCAKFNVAGYDVFKMGLKWVLGQTVVEYFDVIPIWNEEVVAKVYISNFKKLRMYFNFEIMTRRGLVAKGQSVAYVLDIETSRPQPIDKIAQHFTLDTNNLNGEIFKYDFDNAENIISQQEHKITFSDLDYNNHTNNISYISLAFEGMPVEFVKHNYPKVLDIKYLQETFLYDNLQCTIYQNGEHFLYKIINKKDNSDVCIINSHWTSCNFDTQEFYDVLNQIRGKV